MNSSKERRRCALLGIGNRAHSWLKAFGDTYRDCAELVALCDPVVERCEDANAVYRLKAGIFSEVAQMLAEAKPELVVVCGPDHLHGDHIVAALDAGCTVATEKPLCTTIDQARRILDAERRAGKSVFMGFNYRYIPLMSKVRELVLRGAIGRPVSMDLTWYLDYRGHGASYFRRWHRIMALSGGLLVTKASHHFDLANWWMDDEPRSVYARCARNFFGPGNHRFKGERCSTCAHAKECDFHLPPPRETELSAELGYRVGQVRGYVRDYCPFGDEVDICDTHAVLVEYANGGVLNYSLNASAPFEGWNLAINGTGGRLETKITDAKPAAPWIPDAWRRQHRGVEVEWPNEYRIFVMPHRGAAHEVLVPNIAEGHGGGDFKMFDALFLGKGLDDDPLGLFASARDGALSIAIGDAANRSAAARAPVDISLSV
jgi:predicted dehydrogenase